MAKEYFLGLDGGATKTTAIIVDSNSRIVSRVVGGPTNYKDLGEIAERNLQEIILEIMKSFDGKLAYACFGLAGIDTKKDMSDTTKLMEKYGLEKVLGCPIVVVNDVDVILPAVNAESGIAVIGGTGCNFYGVNGNRSHKASGLGYLLSDEGGSYDIGLGVLKSAVKSYDGRGTKTILEKLVLQMAEVSDMRSLKDVIYKDRSKTYVGLFAPLADKAARKGDKVAKKILSDAADEFVSGIKAVMERTGLKGKFDIVFTGSLFTKKVLFDDVKNKIKKIAPKARFHILKDPVIGAAKIAMIKRK